MQSHAPVPQAEEYAFGDATLSYLSYEGGPDAIVFLHATGFLPWMWHPIARNIAPAFRCIAPYFCDHRIIDPDKGGLSWMTLADDMSAFLHGIGVTAPFLVGHSMGATVLTIASAAFNVRPRAMILIEPIFLPEDFYRMELRVEDHPLASKSIRRKNYWEDRQEASAYLRSRPLFKNWDDEMLELYLQYGMSTGDTGGLKLACSPQREASLFMGGMKFDPWPVLSKVSCPVLILEGELSENRSFIDLKKAASLFPRGAYRLVEGAGHLIPMEKPGEITDIIRSFFSTP